jgi:hypothetical protein
LILKYFTKEKPRIIWGVDLALDGSDLLKNERLFLDIILSIHLRSNGPYLTTFLQSTKTGERQGGAMAGGKGGRVSPYDTILLGVIHPTQSRWHKGSVLLTSGGENGPQEEVDGEAARSAVGDGEDDLWWCSDFKGMCQSFLVLPSSFLSGQLLQTATENSNLVAT